MSTEITLQMNPPLLGFEEINTYTLSPVEDFISSERPIKACSSNQAGIFFSQYLQQVKSLYLSNRANTAKAVEEDPDVYVIITLAEKMEEMTANLLAPLFVYRQKGQAAQIVLYDSDFTTRHHLFPPTKHRSCG